MFLSSLLIDTGSNPDRPRPGRLWLRNLYHVHQRLCMGFPSKDRKSADPDFLQPYEPKDFPHEKNVHAERGANRGFLFRVDPQPGGGVMILVQSAIEPDWNYAFHNVDFLAATPQRKTFDPDFTSGQQFRFRLLANPTRKIDTKTRPDGKKSYGQRVPVPEAKLVEWIAKQGHTRQIPTRKGHPSETRDGGFSIDQESIIVQSGYIHFKKRKDNGQRMFSVRYEGVLKVTDPDELLKTVTQGIGSGKGFGFGLLSLGRLE